MISASEIFELLGSGAHRLFRNEIACAPFQRLRSAMFRLIAELQDTETGDPEVANQLRRALSEWLTVPVPFASLDAPALTELESSEQIQLRWGADVNRNVDVTLEALKAIHEFESPLRAAVADAIVDAELFEMDWRIYCHRAAAQHFLSLADSVGCDQSHVRFIHSLSDYRKSRPFDLLIRVGPFRTRGWGAAPAALIHSPRYRELRQFVWTGSSDEAGFGEDPLLAVGGDGDGTASAPDNAGVPSLTTSVAVSWVSTTVREVVAAGGPEDPFSVIDELHFFAESHHSPAARRAVLLHLPDEKGILYPPSSEVRLLTPGRSASDAVRRHRLADGDPTGCFLFWPELDPVSLGAHVSENGNFSLRWKEELRRRAQSHRASLIRELRAAGITLRNLDACLDHWMQPPTSVIHAPQQRNHFRILIDVLDMEAHGALSPRIARTAGWWWEAAWREVARSRGTAIQFGMQEQEIVDEELDRILPNIMQEMCSRATVGETFRIEIPAGQSLSGSIVFLPVRSREEGFVAPESCLKTRLPIAAVEEWRA